MSSEITEQEKYQRCYREPNYRMGARRQAHVVADLVAEIKPGDSFLDVGCGRGEIIDLLGRRGVEVRGFDLVPELCDGKRVIHGDMAALPFADGEFDFVGCFDVVEHLPEDEVDQALNELFRVAGRVLMITTNDRRSHLGDLELHLTRKPYDWWESRLRTRMLVRGWESIEFSTFWERRHDWSWRMGE